MELNRRELLVGASASILAAGLSPAIASSRSRSSLRIAFMTDAHLRAPGDEAYPDDHKGNERIGAAFKAVRDAGVGLVIFGGDNVFAVDYGNTADSATKQFENWKATIAREVRAPTLSVIGNHDIWSGEHADAHAKGGKTYAIEAFGMPLRYYHHDAAGWRFCMLDTYHPDGCHLDDEQMAWLERVVDDFDGPVCLVSHAPIVTVGQFLEQRDPGIHGGYNAPRGWVVGNAADVVRFIARRSNVRLALSGHMHQVSVLDYVGCRFVDGGAVSGAWWAGAYLDHFPANLIIADLDPQGSVAARSVEYEK